MRAELQDTLPLQLIQGIYISEFRTREGTVYSALSLMLQWTDIDLVYGLLYATQVTALRV